MNQINVKNFFENIIFFIAIGLYYFQVVVVGAIGIGEIALILWLILSFFYTGIKVYIFDKKLLILAFTTLLWLTGIIFADIVNSVPITSTIKIIGSIGILFALTIFVTYRLNKTITETFILFFLGIALSQYFSLTYVTTAVYKGFLSNISYDQLIRYYFPYAICFTAFFMMGMLWYFKYKKLAFLVTFLSIFIFIFLGSRSLSLVYLGTSGMILIDFFRNRFSKNDSSKYKEVLYFLAVSIYTLLILILLFKISTVPNIANVNDEKTQDETILLDEKIFKEISNESNVFESLVQESSQIVNKTFEVKMFAPVRDLVAPEGSIVRDKANALVERGEVPFWYPRRHFVQGLYAISSNLLGYGSSYDPNKFNIISDANALFGLPDEPEYIPAHSHIVGAGVFAGIFAIPFWILLIYINAKIVLLSYKEHYLNRFMLFLIPLSLNNIWAIFFSPFSDRILLAFSVAVYVMLLPERKRLEN